MRYREKAFTHLNSGKQNLRGFTLIELLVVIAIIGLLSSIVLVSLGRARAKARDERRKVELVQLGKALEIYFSTYGRYPAEDICCDTSLGVNVSVSGCWVGCNANPPSNNWGPTSDLQELITAGITSQIPVDPINNSTYHYQFEPDDIGQGTPPCTKDSCRWWLRARLETTGAWYYVYSVEKGP